MIKRYCIVILVVLTYWNAFSEGSKNLTPSNTGISTGINTFIGYLEHDWAGNSGDFLDPAASDDEKMYIYIKSGETFYWGLQRTGIGSEELTIALFANGDDPSVDAPVAVWTPLTNTGPSFDSPQNGVIDSYAEALAGPATVVGAGGYQDNSYTNITGTDQDFFIVFLQADGGPNGTYSNDIDDRSWYNFWDFSVYDGSEEKTGRLHCKRWNFTTGAYNNLLSTEFQMFARIPSVLNGQNAGSYVKEIDLAGIDPYSVFVYANSTGADAAQAGTTDFTLLRQSQTTDNALIEYEIYLNNPDIDVYPTSTLPTVTITDANFLCNVSGTGGEAVISFESNQVGQLAVIVDLNGTNGYQNGSVDVIIEAEIGAEGFSTIRWDGLDGLGGTVANGTTISITGRFTAGPLHVPLYDVEDNTAGIKMLDVRPATSFDLIFWDDTNVTTNQTPTIELDGSNTNNHNWTGTNADLHNTWSFGYYQVNVQTVSYNYSCDEDGDGVIASLDEDSDNDGVANAVEGDYLNDADADNVPDYLDEDIVGFVDSNSDGINDNYDQDLDGIVNALDVDSDNDGIPDMVENGLSDTDFDGTLDNGSGITDINGNGFEDQYDLLCITAPVLYAGNGIAEPVLTSVGGFGTAPQNAIGVVDGGFSTFDNTADVLVVDIGIVVPSGEDITIRWATGDLANVITVDQGTSSGGPFTNPQTSNFVATGVPGNDEVYTLTSDSRYLRFRMTTFSSSISGVDAISYSYTTSVNPCGATTGAALILTDIDLDGIGNYLDLDSDNDGIVDVLEVGGSAGTNGQIFGFVDANDNGLNDTQESAPLTLLDSDADGVLSNYLDIDSDNDGILDNVEAQASTAFIASVAGDTDNNGLLDVYDANNGGTLLSPVDTDSNGANDYYDTDSDGDGVSDLIEGHDSDFDGYGDWDVTGANNDISDETGYNLDTDSDGLWDVFDTDNGGTAATVPNSDGAGLANWQDTDDDNDGKLTAGEDINGNSNWADDKTEGQGAGITPDYLYRGDFDGDAIADAADADSDNDGILDSTEDNGEAIDPSGDEDGDSVPNYRDANDATVTAGLSATTDVNGDGVYDVFDSDLDGVPDFLDLDSDGDGLLDAIEANNGAVPFGLSTSTGMFGLQDPDNDGLMNYVDTDAVWAGGISNLSNPDSDSDGVSDYLDIDSDRDGIVDNIEFQTVAGYITSSFNDADGDGIDDSYDPNTGGTLLNPINTDGLDLADYLDADSDNDGVLDIIEGDDTDFNGFGDWDATGANNDITDETGYGIDTDGDGLDDVFDNVTLGAGVNFTGSNTDLQNTDGVDLKDWRDANDDNDAVTTLAEDANGNNDWTDDKTNGQGGGSAIPDYLFNGDTDNDGVFDFADLDSDNDGIFDTDEDLGETIDPSGDEDGDVILNYRDFSDAAVTAGLSSITDSNGDGVYDVFDTDLDGLPDFRDLDSDNDGLSDLLEAGGVDADGNGIVDDATDTDGDGLSDVFDSDNGGTLLSANDLDNDGLIDAADLDSDNDGMPDIIEAGGTDSDNDGKVDDTTDSDSDGLVDIVDSDHGGTAYARNDADNDGIYDYLDLDSDNDGITDPIENRIPDTDGDGYIDVATDTDGDGWSDAVDADNGGTAAGTLDDDNDGILNYQDLDSDNDGYQDILEAGGTDANNDGKVDNALDVDADGVPDNVDVTYFGANGGSGVDTDGDQIDDSFDVDQTAGNDTDGDSIDNTFDTDANGNGMDDNIEANPYLNPDHDGDGSPDSHDLDSDNDGITNVIEYGMTADSGTGQINGFTDANANGWNDAQEALVITPPDSDSDPFSIPDYLDLDADDDGIVDLYEGQTKSSYSALSSNDTDGDGLDDAFDPDNGGVLITPVNTDATGNADYLDADSDGDGVNDNVEGANADKNQYADWDTNFNNDATDETGWDADVDEDGIFDLFDSHNGTGSANVIGSSSAVQDSDKDQTWDFQDTDDDGDGTLTSAEATTPVLDPNGIIPDYLYGDQDSDGDGVVDGSDLDSDNDGLANVNEDGGTGIDPGSDIDSDGLYNYEDNDIDGDGTLNVADTDGDGNGTNTTSFTDVNNDGVIDQFDKDLDGVADFRDLDSDNDGISDVLELGLADANENGTLDEGAGITDLNTNGLDDNYDPTCLPCGGINGVVVTVPDTDIDGIENYLDLDSDNDGITDNREAQTTASYVAPASGDTDLDGLLDVYDEDISAGNAISPTNTDGTDNVDYLDTDSDNDGINDIIEGWDVNGNGFANWDTDGDNDETDETSYNSDLDNDGIWFLFDSNNGLGSIANIDGSNQALQNTDGTDEVDFRDTDDDNDSNLTSTEDTNPNDGNWTNDFTQGGGIVPDYLFAPDQDGDGVLDNIDADSDNDGVINTDEYAGAVYNGAGSPFDDADADGLYNYLDANDVNNASYIDSNNDGIDDQVDQDRDGVPNFFDLDSDNDGVFDGIEVNDGIVHADFSIVTGRFTTGDTDADGLVNSIDTDNGGTALVKSDQDSDGLDDYLDLDSDGDGLTDNIEAQSTLAYAVPSGTDSDGDGMDDTYDNDNGGASLIPVNTDGADEPDYRDVDSDNDTNFIHINIVGDAIEGFDANRNGYSDLDLDQDGLLSDETGFATDTDGDGLKDLFDNYSGFGINNILGDKANLQDTDGDAILDFRDTDDDQDNITTAVEDVDQNGIWTDDKIQGGGATPDYLYFNDSDKDLVADGQDVDGDQDGIANADEYDSGSYPDPFADADGDGIFNYNDPTNPGGLIDSNSDGIWDEYDTDLDGVPNFFDLDSDNDGIPDLVENGGTDADGDGILDGLTDSDGDGLLDTYDVDATMGADVDNDGIDDAFDFSVSGGVDSDGDDIIDSVDRDDDNDGVIDTIDPDEGGTALVIGDFDGDGVNNMFDKDSDNDGIMDLVEAGGADFNGDGEIDAFGDTDGDGLANLIDPDNGGTPLTIPNTDGSDGVNYLDTDSDGDGRADYFEGFDDDGDGLIASDLTGRANAYNNPGQHDWTLTNWHAIYLIFGSANYFDTDGDGVVNLFDPDQGGDFYGNVNGIPDLDGDGIANVLDADDVPLPLDFLSFDGGFEGKEVNLTWVTTNEIGVSHFDIEQSSDGVRFSKVGEKPAINIESTVNTYHYAHKSPSDQVNYYRIKEIDFDGLHAYSDIIRVESPYYQVDFEYYPNPVNQTLNIRVNENLSDFMVRVISVTGSVVYQESHSGINTKEFELDLTNVQTGVYLVLIESNLGIEKFRIAKK